MINLQAEIISSVDQLLAAADIQVFFCLSLPPCLWYRSCSIFTCFIYDYSRIFLLALSLIFFLVPLSGDTCFVAQLGNEVLIFAKLKHFSRSLHVGLFSQRHILSKRLRD